jgi:hypothetical protein
MSNYLTNIYQTLRDHANYFDITGLLPLMLYPNIFQNFPVSAILEDTGHCQNMSIVDTGRYWEILVIPVLQIMED